MRGLILLPQQVRRGGGGVTRQILCRMFDCLMCVIVSAHINIQSDCLSDNCECVLCQQLILK